MMTAMEKSGVGWGEVFSRLKLLSISHVTQSCVDDGTMGRWDDGTMDRWIDGLMRCLALPLLADDIPILILTSTTLGRFRRRRQVLMDDNIESLKTIDCINMTPDIMSLDEFIFTEWSHRVFYVLFDYFVCK